MKPIGNDNYSVRPFKAHKTHTYTYTYPSSSDSTNRFSIIEALDQSDLRTFLTTSAPVNTNGIYKEPLFRGLRSLFYKSGSISMSLVSDATSRGFYPSGGCYVLNFSNVAIGEGIRQGSFLMQVSGTQTTITSDVNGRLIASGWSTAVADNVLSSGSVWTYNLCSVTESAGDPLGGSTAYTVTETFGTQFSHAVLATSTQHDTGSTIVLTAIVSRSAERDFLIYNDTAGGSNRFGAYIFPSSSTIVQYTNGVGTVLTSSLIMSGGWAHVTVHGISHPTASRAVPTIRMVSGSYPSSYAASYVGELTSTIRVWRFGASASLSGVVGNLFSSLGIGIVGKSYPHLTQSSVSRDGIHLVTGSVVNVQYDSIVTIYEHNAICTMEPSELNWSSNPSITQLSPSSSVSGTNKIIDYFASGTLTPYMTTIGLYNSNNELLVIGKLPRAIKRAPEIAQTFVVKWDI